MYEMTKTSTGTRREQTSVKKSPRIVMIVVARYRGLENKEVKKGERCPTILAKSIVIL